jgi:hypothetical protein
MEENHTVLFESHLLFLLEVFPLMIRQAIWFMQAKALFVLDSLLANFCSLFRQRWTTWLLSSRPGSIELLFVGKFKNSCVFVPIVKRAENM